MRKWLQYRVKKAGLPPGTLVHLGNVTEGEIKISLIDYNGERVIEKENATIEECLILKDNPSITWINIRGIHDPKMIETLGQHFGLHPLMMEDILHTGQRSKIDDYQKEIFVVLRILHYNETTQIMEDEQFSLILGNNYVITFIERPHDIFDSIRERIKNPNSRLRNNGSDYLCYALIDCVVDYSFIILEKMDARMEKMDDELANHPQHDTLINIQRLKKDVLIVRRAIWPMREVASQFQRLDNALLTQSTRLYFHDVYDHTIQAIDTIENFRDIAASMLEVHLSNISMRMNEIMKVLTIVSTIFVPMTFIASIYGMNFQAMPELSWEYGYPTALGIMAVVTGLMVAFYKRKGWI